MLDRLRRLMLFRVVMITTLLLVAIYVEAVSETLVRVNPLYIVVITTYVLTLLYALALRHRTSLSLQAYVQVVVDLLIVTGLVYVTPEVGNRSGFMLLYPIATLSGSILAPRGRGLLLALMAALLYASLLTAVRTGTIPPMGLMEVPHLEVRQLGYSIFVTSVSCLTVALIGSYLAKTLQAVGAQLEEVAGQVADLQELNRAIVDSIHSGLMTADEEGRALHLNPYGERLLGRTASQIRSRPLHEVFGSRRFDLATLEARSLHQHLGRFEATYDRGGETTDLGVSVMHLKASDQSQRGYLLVFQDLTDIKRLEREVSAKEKLAAAGEMAAQLAHEIRNPLGAISGSAQVLMAEADVPAEQARLLAIITRESRRLSDTLNQFLLQTRAAPRAVGPVDLGTLIDDAVTLLRNGPEVKASHQVEFDRGEGVHLCLADPAQISQVFWNLARNGLEAMPGGGLLSVSLRSTTDEVILGVRDEGRGMPRSEPEQLFQPMSRGGLGLAIVYQIAKQHRGDITIRGGRPRGTEVVMKLPRFRAGGDPALLDVSGHGAAGLQPGARTGG